MRNALSEIRIGSAGQGVQGRAVVVVSDGMTKIKFVMEQHVGMLTFYQNMRSVVDADPSMTPDWVEVPYTKSKAFTKNLSQAANHVVGTGYGMRQVRAGLARGRADVTFYCTQVPALLAGRAVSRTPYVLCTDMTPIQYDHWAVEYGHYLTGRPLLEQYKFVRNRDCFQQAKYVIAWSWWAAQSLVNDYHVDPRRVEVIPPGVDLTQWRPAQSMRDGVFNILFVGGDFKRKGGHELLEAFRRLPQDRFRLHIVTRDPIPEERGVTVYRDLTPNSPELVALYQQAHAYVHPANAEAYGIAAIEAAASGLPVIATRIGGLQSVVDHEVSGYLLEQSDPDEISTLLLKLEQDSDLHEKMSLAARARAERFFDVSANIQRVLGILKAAGRDALVSDGEKVTRGAFPHQGRALA